MEIIAEAAQGFEGDSGRAKALVELAAAGGADGIKFQLVIQDELCTSGYVHAPLFKQLEMPDAVWEDVSKCAVDNNVALYLDVFGPASLSLAEGLGVKGVKIHGTDLNNIGFLEQVAASSIDTILLGIGGGFMDEIEIAVDALAGKNVVLLAGFQAYPTAHEDNQVSRLVSLAANFGVREGLKMGFADHAEPDEFLATGIAAVAVGAGAVVIEKHLTPSRLLAWEDAESAMNVDEFKTFCQEIRACAEVFGSCQPVNDLGMSKAELSYRVATRRHVVAARHIEAGTVITTDMVALKRTESEVAYKQPDDVVGRVASVNMIVDTPMTSHTVKDA